MLQTPESPKQMAKGSMCLSLEARHHWSRKGGGLGRQQETSESIGVEIRLGRRFGMGNGESWQQKCTSRSLPTHSPWNYANKEVLYVQGDPLMTRQPTER